MKSLDVKSPLWIAGIGVSLGFVGTILLYDKPAGISVPILFGLTLMGLLLLSRIEQVKITRGNLWLIAPVLFFTMMFAIRAMPFLRMLNVLASLSLLLLWAYGLRMSAVLKLNFGDLLKVGFMGSLLSGVILPLGIISASLTNLQKKSGISVTARRVLVGLALALPMLILFTALFASADLVFGGMVEGLFENFNIPDLIGQGILIVTLAWIAMGGFAYALTREQVSKEGDEAETHLYLRERIGQSLSMVEGGIVLGSVNALFLTFVVVQFAALFGGEAFLEARGLTYSDYARRGFFELVAVSVIVLGLILSLELFVKRGSGRQSILFLVGSGLLVAMTLLILVSAFQRMQLYELAYGFTQLRVLTHIFMVWLAILLVYVLAFMAVGKPQLFAAGVILVSIGYLGTLNLLNPDAFIVRQNIARYQNGEALDIAYLGGLSADAVPAMLPLLQDEDAELRTQTGQWLNQQLFQLDSRADDEGWASYHWSLARAYRFLDARRATLDSYGYPDYEDYYR